MIDGVKIQLLREGYSMTQKELGFKVGVSANMISLLEAEHKTTNFEVMARIADTLGVTMDELRKKL